MILGLKMINQEDPRRADRGDRRDLVELELDLAAHGVAILGRCPSGLPTFGLPDVT